MSPQGADFLYTVALITIGLVLVTALIKLVEVLFIRIEADHITGYHADAISAAWYVGRDQHRTDVRWDMRRARRHPNTRGA